MSLTFTIIVIVQANPTEKIDGAQQNHGPTTNLRHIKWDPTSRPKPHPTLGRGLWIEISL